uniref:Uncharacterized protein n=1 Tax=Pan troglodytes TaxID=9598 RepID=A0A2I3TRD6_PANTR
MRLSCLLWLEPPLRKKPVLSARNSMMFGHLRPPRIPRLRGKFNLHFKSPKKQRRPGQEDNKRAPVAPGDSGKPHFLLVQSQALGGNVHLKSLTENNQTDKAQVHAVSFMILSKAMSILPFGKPDPLPTKGALKVLGKDHLPSSPGLLMVGRTCSPRILQTLGPSRSSPPRAAGHSSRKRKLSGPPTRAPTAKLPCLSPEALLGQASQREGRLQQGNMRKNVRVQSRTSKFRRLRELLRREKEETAGRRGGHACNPALWEPRRADQEVKRLRR